MTALESKGTLGKTAAKNEPATQPTPVQPQQPQVQIDDVKAVASYANFCRVTGTPEEMIIDFGLNPQPMGVPSTPIAITQRIITNYYTAKRLLQVLQMTLQRHEGTFGVVETDVQRRVQPTVTR
jgi:hypothetical protein